jgi:flagellar motor switch/type III secretory pathway protein FliN
MSAAVQSPEPRLVKPISPATAESGSLSLEDLSLLPLTLSLDVPVVRFTIGDLLKLSKGAIVESGCHHTSDVPLRVNQVLIGWTEFEVVGERLAVRITELS